MPDELTLVQPDGGRSTAQRDDVYPPVPQGVYGVCEGCGAVAWELLEGLSPMCLGCDPSAYARPDDDDEYDDWQDDDDF